MYAMPVTHLYAWQEECLDIWFKNGCRGVVGVATGAGKTMLALAAAYNLAARNPSVPLRIRIIVPRVFLAQQWRGDIMRELGVSRRDIGLYYGPVKEDTDRPFVIYVLNTARACISRHILKDISQGCSIFLICDECHHFASSENAHVFDFLPHIPSGRYYSLGLSATPDCDRFDEVIVPALGREIYRYGLAEALRDNVTASYNIFNVAVDFTPDEADDYAEFSDEIAVLRAKLIKQAPFLTGLSGSQYFRRLHKLSDSDGDTGRLARSLLFLYLKRRELLHKARARLHCGALLVQRLIHDHRIIVFTERIETSDELYERLSEAFPGKICRYHSKMDAPSKQRALECYRSGETKVIICCRALDEGLNVPETDAGIILSASVGDRQRIQRLGRVVRRGAGERPKSLYYIHIPGTSEPSKLLSGDAQDVNAHTLCYDNAEERFLRPEYDGLAEAARAEFMSSGASKRQLEHVDDELKRGVLRNDFLLSESVCRERLAAAPPDERDYWITMLYMAKARARDYT